MDAAEIEQSPGNQGKSVACRSSGEVNAASACDRLRIMHVIDRLDVGGTEKVMMKLTQALDPGLFEHCICTLRGASPRARSWNPDITLFEAGSEGRNFQLNALRLARIMKTVRPAIVHSRNWGGIEAILAARSAGVPVIIHSEHGYQLEMQQGLPWRQRLFRHFSYRSATSIFAVTDELRAYHEAQAGCTPGTIKVIYNGVDLNKFKPRPEVRNPMRQQLNIPPDRLIIGFIGRLVALKDVMTLLKAANDLAPDLPKVHVLLVGSGPEVPLLQGFAHQSSQLEKRVTFAGVSEDVADLLNAMDVFVLPSLLEGMSNTLLEAMATGLPVIATKVGGNPEVVTDGGCGFLFEPGAKEQLTRALRKLLGDEHQRAVFGKAARDIATSKFSLHGMLNRYSDLYLGLARQQGVPIPPDRYVRN